MEEIIILKLSLFGLCVLGGVVILIFFIRKNEDVVDYFKIINDLNSQMEQNLKNIKIGNKKIDTLEREILKCKKKLGFKLFTSDKRK